MDILEFAVSKRTRFVAACSVLQSQQFRDLIQTEIQPLI